jgi:hypothetical protein
MRIGLERAFSSLIAYRPSTHPVERKQTEDTWKQQNKRRVEKIPYIIMVINLVIRRWAGRVAYTGIVRNTKL